MILVWAVPDVRNHELTVGLNIELDREIRVQ